MKTRTCPTKQIPTPTQKLRSRIIAAIVAATFILTQCGIGMAGPIYQGKSQQRFSAVPRSQSQILHRSCEGGKEGRNLREANIGQNEEKAAAVGDQLKSEAASTGTGYDKMIRDLSDRRAELREDASEELLNQSERVNFPSDVLITLARRVGDNNIDVRYRTATALLNQSNRVNFPVNALIALVGWLKSSVPAVRHNANNILGQYVFFKRIKISDAIKKLIKPDGEFTIAEVVERPLTQEEADGVMEVFVSGRATGAAAVGKMILVVDDEPSVRGVTKAMLEYDGYTVVEAEDAKRALEILGEPNNIDGIVSDRDMPGMSGVEFSVNEAVEGIPFLLITGGSSTRPDGLRPDAEFLAKPFGLQPFLLTVAAMLTPAVAPIADTEMSGTGPDVKVVKPNVTEDGGVTLEVVREAPSAAAPPAVVPQPAGVTMHLDIENYRVRFLPNGSLQTIDTTSGQSKTVTIDELRNTAKGRAIVVVDDNEINRKVLRDLLKPTLFFDEIVVADTAHAVSEIERLQAAKYTVFVLNNSAVTPAFDMVDSLAVIGLGAISIVDETNKKAIENAVYARLAIFV